MTGYDFDGVPQGSCLDPKHFTVEDDRCAHYITHIKTLINKTKKLEEQ